MPVFSAIKMSVTFYTLSAALFAANSAFALERVSIGHFAPQLEQAWHHQVFGDKTFYEYVAFGEMDSIQAQGAISASGLFADVSSNANDKQNIEWKWRVDQIHQSADLRVKEKEDFAASLFLVFADTGRLMPSYHTLIYAWSSMDEPVGTIIASPHDPDRIRTIILGNNETPLASWVSETRNFMDDYQKAFGALPETPLEQIGIFTDNDNTQEPVTAYYAPITVW